MRKMINFSNSKRCTVYFVEVSTLQLLHDLKWKNIHYGMPICRASFRTFTGRVPKTICRERGHISGRVPGTHYSKLTIFIVMGIMILGCMENYFFASIHHLVTTLLWQVLNAPFLISEGVPGSWHISGRVPGTRCLKSMGAYAPMAPVLTEALIH